MTNDQTIQAFIDSLTVIERHHLCWILNHVERNDFKLTTQHKNESLVGLRDAYRELRSEAHHPPNFKR